LVEVGEIRKNGVERVIFVGRRAFFKQEPQALKSEDKISKVFWF